MNRSVSVKDAAPRCARRDRARRAAARAPSATRAARARSRGSPSTRKAARQPLRCATPPGHRGTEPGAQTGPEGEDRQRHRPARRPGTCRPGSRWTAACRRPRRCRPRTAPAAAAASSLPDRTRGHRRPHGERHGENVAAVGAVGEGRHRDADGDVEHPERDAGERRDAAIGELQLLADRLDQGRDREAVRDVERVDRRQHPQHVPAVAGAAAGGAASLPAVTGRVTARASGAAHGLQVQSCALLRQPPPGAPVQARPRTTRPLAAPVASPVAQGAHAVDPDVLDAGRQLLRLLVGGVILDGRADRTPRRRRSCRPSAGRDP